jgi:hypothetical protein
MVLQFRAVWCRSHDGFSKIHVPYTDTFMAIDALHLPGRVL